jgi:hypothetical protein
MIRPGSGRLIALLLLAQPLLAGCGDTFDPFAPSELAFSIHGSLDATTDTQWVRVRPLQASQETLTGPIDAVVTLEEIETGVVVEMSDSIFPYRSPNLDETGVSGHNFFTTLPMVPGRHYRLTATRSDGASSTATVEIPVFDPILRITHFADRSTPFGALSGRPHIAMIFADMEVLDPPACGYFAPVYRAFFLPRESTTGDAYTFAMADATPPKLAMIRPDPSCSLGETRITIIASGDRWEWPRDHGIGLDEALFPNSSSRNIDRGIGFLSGINRMDFPWERCVPVTGASCILSYTPLSVALSATLLGRVLDSCTGLPVVNADVALLASGDNAILIARTDATGMFRIRGLNPGLSHTLTLKTSGYFDYVFESLHFEERGTDTRTFAMTSRQVCRVN